MTISFFTSDEVFMIRLKAAYRDSDNVLKQLYEDLERHLDKYEDREDDDLYLIASSKAKELKENCLKGHPKAKSGHKSDEETRSEEKEETGKRKRKKTIFFEELSQ